MAKKKSFTTIEVVNLHNIAQDLIDSNISDVTYEFNKFLINIKKSTKKIVEEVKEDYNLFLKEREKISEKFCDKDDDGKPIIHSETHNGRTFKIYQGLKSGIYPEYDETMEKISKDEDELNNKKHSLDISKWVIKEKDFPKRGIKGTYQEILDEYIIEED